MTTAIPLINIAWCGPGESSSELGVDERSRFDVHHVAPGEIASTPAQLVVLDRAGFAGLEELQQVYRGVVLPALVLIDADEAESALSWIRPSDAVCLRQTPPALLSHILVQLFRRRAYPVDTLTGLPHRRQLLVRLEQLLPLASEAHPVSLFLANIDTFKAINDQYGHDVGDQVLLGLATLLSRCCQATDLISRYAGEEFAVLFTADEAVAAAMAEELRSMVEAEELVEGIRITVSLGVATAEEPLEPRLLLQQASEALYAAKAAGRNTIRCHGEMRRHALEHGEDLALTSFENLTRVVSDRIATTIARRGRQLFEQLKEQADIDALTQLYSRRYLDRRLEHEYSSARSGSGPLTVALIDLDHFGRVNKRYGWPSGDRVLTEIAELIRSQVRSSDWVGRYGGEEICLVMPDTSVEQARTVLERLRQSVDQHPFFSTGGQPIHLTISIGAAELDGEAGDLEDLIERASTQLLAAKRSGRNQVCAEGS